MKVFKTIVRVLLVIIGGISALFGILGFIVDENKTSSSTITIVLILIGFGVLLIWLGLKVIKIDGTETVYKNKPEGSVRLSREEKLAKKQEQLAQQERERLEKLKWTEISKNMVSINETDKKICLRNTIYDWKDLVSCEILFDEKSVTKTTTTTSSTSRSNPSLGKALVGGALLGPVGTYVGGKKTKQKTSGYGNVVSDTTDFCTSLKLKVNLDSITNPCVFITYINSRTSKESGMYINASESCEKAYEAIQAIIERTAKEQEIEQ